jgi:diguanylate cyclase (GGDEF)-like protein
MDHCMADKVTSVTPSAQDLTADLEAQALQATLRRLGAPALHPGPLVELLTAKPTDLDAILKAISRSGTLTARILAVVNSAAFGVSHTIRALPRAVALLGSARCRSLALAYGTRLVFERCALPKPTLDTLWNASLQKACAARLCCLCLEPVHADLAFSIGLIQDLGLPMLMSVDPDFYDHLLADCACGERFLELERERFGLTHAAVGQGLLFQWSAAEKLQQAVLQHHRPVEPQHPGSDSLGDAVALANFVAGLLPHVDEPMSSTQLEWLIAIHARFLTATYPTPDRFLDAVAQSALETRGENAQQAADKSPLHDSSVMRRLIREVAADGVNHAARLSRLEAAVGKQREDMADLRFQAYTDPLTKVLNRAGFSQLAQRRLDNAAARNLGAACLLIDLDRFKPINDQFGHDAGDLLLRGLAKLLRRCVDRNDLIGRLGGDEFVIFLTGIDEPRVREIADRLLAASKSTVVRVREDTDVLIRFSLGAVFQTPAAVGLTLDALVAAADHAMYATKRAGKGGATIMPLQQAQQDVAAPTPDDTVIHDLNDASGSAASTWAPLPEPEDR